MTDDLLDEQVTNIIANKHFPPPAHAFNLDDTVSNNNEGECIDGLHDDEEHQSFAIRDEGNEDDCIGGSEDEHAVDDDIRDIQDGADFDDDDGFSIEDVNDEEYQSNEMDIPENIRHNQYGRIGVFIAVSVVLICFAVGVGASNRAEQGRFGESASSMENVVENNVTAAPSECIPKTTFEIVMENEVEEFDCFLDSICNDVGACDGNIGIVCHGACNSPGGCTDNQGEIQSCSCLDKDACNTNSGNIGLFSCNGKHGCKRNKGDIGTLSCNGSSRACFGNHGDVESEACNGVQACLENHGSISFKSCGDLRSCHLNKGPVGEESCNGEESCMKNHGTIGRKSCNGEKSCCGNTNDIGSGECNEDFECCNAEVSQCGCPLQLNITSVEEASVEEASVEEASVEKSSVVVAEELSSNETPSSPNPAGWGNELDFIAMDP